MQKKNKVYSLVNGTFTPTDAKSVLFALINSKINFHTMEAFAITVQSNGDVSNHNKRVKQLRKTLSQASKLVEQASKKNALLQIKGNIEIDLISAPKRK